MQFPPGLDKTYLRQLEDLLDCLVRVNADHEWPVAAEVRNRSWYDEDVYELLAGYNTALVIHDFPKSATPMVEQMEDTVYIRFHGPTGNYRDSYPEDFLSEYSLYIKEWLEKGKMVYVYFNNTMGDAINNLQTLNRFVRSG